MGQKGGIERERERERERVRRIEPTQTHTLLLILPCGSCVGFFETISTKIFL